MRLDNTGLLHDLKPVPSAWSYQDIRVRENRLLADKTVVLELAAHPALAQAKPGHFVMMRGAWGRDPLLPRALSILDVAADGTSRYLVKQVGRGTELLLKLSAGDAVSVLGPLGQPFPEMEQKEIWLVGGGVGVAPLLWWARNNTSTQRTFFYGARSMRDFALLDEIAATGSTLIQTTEDGSQGTRGYVTDALESALARAANRADLALFTCGPDPMMHKVVTLGEKFAVPVWLSVEGEMACGIGACLGCAIPAAHGPRPFLYGCKDGPVFNAADVKLGSGR